MTQSIMWDNYTTEYATGYTSSNTTIYTSIYTPINTTQYYINGTFVNEVEELLGELVDEVGWKVGGKIGSRLWKYVLLLTWPMVELCALCIQMAMIVLKTLRELEWYDWIPVWFHVH